MFMPVRSAVERESREYKATHRLMSLIGSEDPLRPDDMFRALKLATFIMHRTIRATMYRSELRTVFELSGFFSLH